MIFVGEDGTHEKYILGDAGVTVETPLLADDDQTGDRCIISQDSQGNAIADVWVCVDVEELRDQYEYLSSLNRDWVIERCDELADLLRWLEAMLELIDEATATEEEA